MENLATQSCEACRIDAPLVETDEYNKFLMEIPDWQVVTVDGINRLSRAFKFKDYQEALTFTNKVAVMADTANHHPALLLEWGLVTVTWWSHKIKGLHKNDFIMAAKTDILISSC